VTNVGIAEVFIVMSFQVLAIAPIGIGEKTAARLLQFLSQVFYLEWNPEVEIFKKGGICFVQTQSFSEAKTTALRLQMLGADFRIINPKGHVGAEGHGRRRVQLKPPLPARRADAQPAAPPEDKWEASEDHDTLIVSEPVKHPINDPHRKQTREVKALPEDLRASEVGLEFDDNNRGRSPFPGVEEIANESMFEKETRDLQETLRQVRERESTRDAEDGDDDELHWDFNEPEEDPCEMAPGDVEPSLEQQNESDLVGEAEDDDRTPFFGINEGVDPCEFDKETSELTPLVEPELVMLDGSEPKKKRPSLEVDFLPPSTGLEAPIDFLELNDFDDHRSDESTIPPVDISFDDLDDE